MFKSMLALAVALSAATYSWADDDDDLKPRPDDGRPEHTLRLSQLMKYKILIQDDQPAGQVVDVILSNGGCVDYIVASYEDQYYTIPYQAAAVRYDDSLVFVDIAPATFREVQFFSNDNWPDFYVPTYRQQVFSTFGLRADQVNRNGRSTFRQNLDNDDADDAARRERRQENREDRQQRRDDRATCIKSAASHPYTGTHRCDHRQSAPDPTRPHAPRW